MNKTEKRATIMMVVGIATCFTFMALGETDWGYCAKLPCPPIPLALGIIAILGFLAFFPVGVFYLLFGPQDESKVIPSGSEFSIDKEKES